MIINKVLLNKYKHDSRFIRLNQLAQPVKEIYFLGDNLLKTLKKPRVAIVGSRKVSEYGRYVTEKLTKDLVDAGVVIISGLALGVDSIAHQSAIKNKGVTIAVLPTGLDKIYPAIHTNLAKKILINKGILLSEHPIKSNPPLKYQFIARNRIISALADAVIITEAAEKSGSLHTANFALELGCEVFAVPGNINSPNSKGTNKLIQIGATPVLDSKDVLDSLGIEAPKLSKSIALRPDELVIYNLLKINNTDYNQLMKTSKYPVAKLNQILTSLELKDVIHNSGNNTWELMNS